MDYIRYDNLLDSSLRMVVRKALEYVAENGLKGEHHFLITFITSHKGVTISKLRKEEYPAEMTILLQEQFSCLEVGEDSFSMKLVFDGKDEVVVVPYTSIIAFADPGACFGLRFYNEEEVKSKTKSKAVSDQGNYTGIVKNFRKNQDNLVKNVRKEVGRKSTKENSSKKNRSIVVSIDDFRK